MEKTLLSSFALTAAFDIVIVAAFIYVVILWFRQARSHTLAAGVALTAGLYFFAQAASLELTRALFDAFLPVFFIALVVIFQADLRRFFEVVGVWGTGQALKTRKFEATTIGVLARVLENLAAKKIGALMVIRGREPIERHISGGVSLMGNVSAQLLESIFDPSSPGHDGAVVIEGDIVTKFAAHLPLSHDAKQIGAHGTRHAAALGVSERSDSLCLIVSEETGLLSIASRGALTRVSLSEARSFLEDFYGEKYPRKEWHTWKNILERNWREKAAALLIALLLWYFVLYG